MATESEAPAVREPELFDTGLPMRRKPTAEEIETTVGWAVKMRINKNWRGWPPKGMTWEDLYQAVAYGTLLRIQNFRHGGKKTFKSYCAMAAFYSLMDIGNENVKRSREEEQAPRTYPLFDDLD